MLLRIEQEVEEVVSNLDHILHKFLKFWRYNSTQSVGDPHNADPSSFLSLQS
jgi:hypothetical protein